MMAPILPQVEQVPTAALLRMEKKNKNIKLILFLKTFEILIIINHFLLPKSKFLNAELLMRAALALSAVVVTKGLVSAGAVTSDNGCS